MLKVPLSEPNIDETDISEIISSLKTPNLTDGPKLRKFEQKFNQITKTKYALGVSNATSALFLSLLSLNIGKGIDKKLGATREIIGTKTESFFFMIYKIKYLSNTRVI